MEDFYEESKFFIIKALVSNLMAERKINQFFIFEIYNYIGIYSQDHS